MNMSAVTEKLEKKQRSYQVLQHQRAFRAQEEARSIGIYSGMVVKALLLDTVSGHVLAVIPANRKLDLDLVRKAVGDSHAHLASEAEISKDLTGCDLGAIPPLESVVHLPVYIDPEVLSYETVVVAGSQTESVRARTEDIFSGEWATITPLAIRPEYWT
jgi:Ala-tRNA(Pro) deacylase